MTTHERRVFTLLNDPTASPEEWLMFGVSPPARDEDVAEVRVTPRRLAEVRRAAR